MGKPVDLGAEDRVRVARLVQAGGNLKQVVRMTGLPRGAVARYVAGQADLALKLASNTRPNAVAALQRRRLDADVAALARVDDSDIDPRACAALWAAVLARQVLLARGLALSVIAGTCAASRQRESRRARDWLRGRDCRMICDWLGLEHDLLIVEFERGFPRIEGGPRWSVRAHEGRSQRAFRIAAE